MVGILPLDVLEGFPGWYSEFDLFHRQEISRTAGGKTLVKNLGRPVWKAAFATRSLKPNELDAWKARFRLLDGSLQVFQGRPLSRCFPIAYPNGKGLGNVSGVKIAAMLPDNRTVRFSGLPVGYKASVGDYIQIAAKLYQLAGLSGDGFELYPHLVPGTAIGNVVTLVRPFVPMIILPGTYSAQTDPATGSGTISFQAIEN